MKLSRPTIQNPAKITDKKIKSITGYDPETLTDPNGLEVKITPVMMFVPDGAITDQLTPQEGCRFMPNAVHRLIDRALNNDKYFVFNYTKEDLYLFNACLESGGRKANTHITAVLNDDTVTVGSVNDNSSPGSLRMDLSFGLKQLIDIDDGTGRFMSIPVWKWIKTGIGNGYITWNQTDQPFVVLEGPGYKVIFSAIWEHSNV
jgi:hypothetical protein